MKYKSVFETMDNMDGKEIYFLQTSSSSNNSGESSSSSSSEDDLIAKCLPNIIIAELLMDNPKNENYVEETVPLYSENQFIQHFRMSREIVQNLKTEFEQSEYYPKKDNGYQRITSEKCILAFLWFASNEAVGFRDVADRFNVSISTLHGIVKKVALFISNLSQNFICWPSLNECRKIEQGFREMGFPDVIGRIDGTHIRIDAPKEDPESYLNRKKYYSVQVQLVCDDAKKIRDVFIGFSGSVHDARAFRNSPLFHNLPQNCRDYVILGDSAYPYLRNLLTPYKDNGNLSNVQESYNKKLSHCRVNIEHSIGLLKQRFRQLYHLKSRNIHFICHFVRACCVLHTICIGDEIFDVLITNEGIAGIDVAVDDEDERNEVGFNYRNYVAAFLKI